MVNIEVLWVASDWHLSPYTSLSQRILVGRFLAMAQTSKSFVVLNGDIFEGLFCPLHQAQAAHPEVMAQLHFLHHEQRLQQLCGNHDLTLGPVQWQYPLKGIGRVLVTHGHLIDGWQDHSLRHLGDHVSQTLGFLPPVRYAARLAEQVTQLFAGRTIKAQFKARAKALVHQENCELGIFGHIHQAEYQLQNRYANAGYLSEHRLEYLELNQSGVFLRHLAEW